MTFRVRATAGTQHATFDGKEAGEGLAIFLSQKPTAVSRYRFSVKAITDQGTLQVGEIYSSPPTATNPPGPPSRMIAGAVCPGATSWAVDVTCADASPADEGATVVLTSSKCCTSPIGVSRVQERYLYVSNSVTGGSQTFPIPPGRRLKSWSAVASGVGDGAVTLSNNTGTPITVSAGYSVSGEPGNFIGLESITFANVVFFIEYEESA